MRKGAHISKQSLEFASKPLKHLNPDVQGKLPISFSQGTRKNIQVLTEIVPEPHKKSIQLKNMPDMI